jgi:hypothetical protein
MNSMPGYAFRWKSITPSFFAAPKDLKSLEPFYDPNPSDAIDTEGELIAERFGISLKKGEAIAEWIIHNQREAEIKRAAELIPIFLALMMRPGNVRARLVALCFATGLNRINHFNTLADAAEALGVSRASISRLQIYFRNFLGLRKNEHSRKDETCLRYQNDKLTNHWRRKAIPPGKESFIV